MIQSNNYNLLKVTLIIALSLPEYRHNFLARMRLNMKQVYHSMLVPIICLTLLIGIIPTGYVQAVVTPFNQGAGYQTGAYDKNAAQPAAFNWSRQSNFNGPESPVIKWKFTPGGYVNSSTPAVGSDGTIYIGSWDKHLYAVNPDGSQKWAFLAGSWFGTSSPAIGSDGTIYVGNWDHNLYAVNPDGSEKWHFATGDAIEASPAIGADGTVYTGSDDQKLYAINPDGSKRWDISVEADPQTIPAIGADGSIYYGDLAINPDGTKKWNMKAGRDVYPTIGVDGTIYRCGGSLDYTLYANNRDGSLKWTFKAEDGMESTPAIASDGTIYVGSNDFNIYAVNPDGSKKWQFKVDCFPQNIVIGRNGIVYALVASGSFYAINPNGSLKWQIATEEETFSVPSLGSDGVIYLGVGKSLYAIGESSGGTAPASNATGNANTHGANRAILISIVLLVIVLGALYFGRRKKG